MKIWEASTVILKTRRANLLQGFWKEDLKDIVIDLKDNWDMLKSPKNIKANLRDAKSLLIDLPFRVKIAFGDFKRDFFAEAARIDDPKEKAVFTLKVAGLLTALIYNTFEEYQMSYLQLGGKKMSRVFAIGILLRVGHAFVLRFLNELEGELTDPEDLKKIQFLRMTLEGEEAPSAEDELPHGPAFDIVDRLKRQLKYHNDQIESDS